MPDWASVTSSVAVMSTVSDATIDEPVTWSIVPPASMLTVVPDTSSNVTLLTSTSSSATPESATLDWKSLVGWLRRMSSVDVKSAVPDAMIEVPVSWSIIPPASMSRFEARTLPNVSSVDSFSTNPAAPPPAVTITVASSLLASSRTISPPEVRVVVPEMLISLATEAETPSSVIVPPAAMLRLLPSPPPRIRSLASTSTMASSEVSTSTVDWKSLVA